MLDAATQIQTTVSTVAGQTSMTSEPLTTEGR